MTASTVLVDETVKNGVQTEQVETTFLSASDIRQRFDTLKDLSDEQMTALNKKVVKKIDWRLMPCITVMFLMK